MRATRKLMASSALSSALLSSLTFGVQAQPAPAGATANSGAAAALEPVVITGSGLEQRVFDTPYAIGVVDGDALRTGGLMVNLSETLARVPGLTVNLRNNYAQDLQISSRGFGARSTFGVRGIRLYTDGIPATMPDGSGQVSHFDLAGASRIEVLRGPFSALYGNSSGGVIALVSASPRERAATVDVDVGSFDTRQVRLGVEAPLGNGFDLRAQASHFETDNFREHAAARRDLGNVRLGWKGANDTVTVLLNSVTQPAQDPLGLTRAQFDANPRQTTPQAFQFDTRKDASQTQTGVQWRHRFAEGGALQESAVTAYTGTRSVTQWQAIPPATQAPARHPGGVIDFDREYRGLDARLVWRWERAQLVIGASTEQQDEERRGFENFVGTPPAQRLGVTGALRRDESNTVRTTDLYAQGEVALGPAFAATLGARTGRLDVRSSDRYLANGDDSGTLRFSYTNPVAALQWHASPQLNVYVSAGRGFESPTLNELAYRPDGNAGLNTNLKPQKSRQVELGAKWREPALGVSLDAAVFRANTQDEIVVQTNTSGRSTFQNVGRTQRQGVEIGGGWQISRTVRAQLALTWLHATFEDDFLSCASTPCTAPTLRIPAGNRIPGTIAKSGFAELAWQPQAATTLALEVRGQGSMAVNDLNSDASGRVVLLGLRASQSVPLPVGRLELLARIDNLTDRRYAGTVIVNEGNGRFFEPGAPRTALLSVRWRVGF